MEHTDCQVLAPDSVAWYIQAALTADRIGNEHTRDLALAEAQRIAAARRLVPCYDCRTNEQRIKELSQQVGLLQAEHVSPADEQWGRDRLAELQRRILALETAMRSEHLSMHAMFSEHQARQAALEACVANLNLSGIASRIAYLERHAQGITGPEAGL